MPAAFSRRRSRRARSACAIAAASLTVLGTLHAAGATAPSRATQDGDHPLVAMVGGMPEVGTLRSWHDRLAREPHVAGTDGDARVIEELASIFQELGLETEVHEIWPLLPHPVSASVEIVGATPVGVEGTENAPRRGIVPLPIREKNLAIDPATAHPGLDFGWNAFSASGEATGEVVYANYGTKQDFETLREWGVDVTGKVVLARYGGNYRGYKARFAQEAGAVALLMYIDPADGGFTRGETWPDGGWANATCIQRGSIVTLPYKGDPLTPFAEATKDAERIAIGDLDLPKIPVQPIGYAAASRIIVRMQGDEVPEDSWRGGLPVPYRLTGGADLRVRVAVEQDLRVRRTANVIARLEGATRPDEVVVIGSHHDAWGFGAGDPLAGTIVTIEAARVLAEAARRGERPDRTIVFAAWGAEEYGVIGSTEWVEANRDDLVERAVAYVNLDMAAMGPNFGSSASPVLREAIVRAATAVPQARDENGRTLAETWAGGENGPRFGDLGGGSDHVGFLCHAGVPSLSLGARGSAGVSYHSNYDTLAWYRATVGTDYEPALMLARVASRLVADLATSPLPAYDFGAIAPDVRRHLEAHRARAEAAGMAFDDAALQAALDRLADSAERLENVLAVARPALGDEWADTLGALMLAADRRWLDPEGLPGRPWYRNLAASDDPESGYAPAMLPGVLLAIRAGDSSRTAMALDQVRRCVDAIAEDLDEIRTLTPMPAGD